MNEKPLYYSSIRSSFSFLEPPSDLVLPFLQEKMMTAINEAFGIPAHILETPPTSSHRSALEDLRRLSRQAQGKQVEEINVVVNIDDLPTLLRDLKQHGFIVRRQRLYDADKQRITGRSFWKIFSEDQFVGTIYVDCERITPRGTVLQIETKTNWKLYHLLRQK